MIHHQSFKRVERLKSLIIAAALRLRRPDFASEKVIVSIIGDHISDLIRADGLFEREPLDILRSVFLNGERCHTQVAIDVGANIGNHTLFFADLFSRVIAFEPNPLARSILQINVELNGATNVDIRPVGLSDRPSRCRMSFDLLNLGAARAEVPHSGHEGSVSVPYANLVIGDEAVETEEAVGLIKIDVEGAELSVLKGLQGTIQQHWPIIVLEQLQDQIDAVSETSPAFELLISAGYTAWTFESARRFSSSLGKAASLITGRWKHRIYPLTELQARDYFALIFTPPDYEFPPTNRHPLPNTP